MFKGVFGSTSPSEVKKETTSSSTSDDNKEEEKSPRRQYELFLIQTNKLEEELNFKFSERKDNYRSPLAYKDGGITCDDPKQVEKLRSVGGQMIKIVGRKILSGQFNLTKISFPIRACYPKTALYNSISCCCIFPYFLNSASKQTNPVERFKLTISCFLSSPYYLNMFLKPLNPIIGQTLQGTLVDGTQIYAEQISHHPPISYFLIIGPQSCYKFSGYYDFVVSPGLNSLTLKNTGKRRVQFKNGDIIQGTYAKNEFSSTFIGTSRIEQIDECIFSDAKNDLSCRIQFDKVKKHPSDFFQSFVIHKKEKISKMFGSYCGYIEFDGKRYWDGRDLQALHIQLKQKIGLLPSDWSYRDDIYEYLKNPKELDIAQKAKQHLQQIQRKDTKLRGKYDQIIKKELQEFKAKQKAMLKQQKALQKEQKKLKKKKKDKKQKKEKGQKQQKEEQDKKEQA